MLVFEKEQRLKHSFPYHEEQLHLYTKEKQPLFPVEREMHLATPMSLNDDF